MEATAQPKRRQITPRQAYVLPTLKAWLMNEANTDRLAQILTDPVFIAAIQYAADFYRPTTQEIYAGEAEAVARKAAAHMAVLEVPERLKTLLVKGRAPAPDAPWEHIYPNIQ